MKPKTPNPWSANIKGYLHRNPWFNVVEQEITLPSGQRYTYYTISFPRPAVGVVVRHDDKFLLLYQYRFIVDEYVWAIPSGGVEEGETPEEAAARELAEEAGYRAKSLIRLFDCYASYGCSNQQFILFLAENLEPSPHPIDHNEVISTKWFTRGELVEMIQKNEVVDNLSLSPLLYVLLEDHPRASVK